MPSMDQLQAFVAAADEGSFSAAGRSLRKAQSAISTAVINLEIDVGVELFDRSGRNPQLTAAGTALLKFARSVLHSNQEFQAHAASISEGVETQLCIAVEQGIFVHSLTSILSEFGQQFPFHLRPDRIRDIGTAGGRALLTLVFERSANQVGHQGVDIGARVSENEVLAARFPDDARIADILANVGTDLQIDRRKGSRASGEVNATEIDVCQRRWTNDRPRTRHHIDDARRQAGLF